MRFTFTLKTVMIALALLSGIVVAGAYTTVRARPVTGSGSIGSMIYNGVAVVTTGEVGSNILELGNNGQEIVSSGDLYLRPQALTEAQGVRFTTDATGRTSVHAKGGVCFATGQCQDTWPTGTSTSLWTLSSGILSPSTATDSLTWIQPDDTGAAELVSDISSTETLRVSNTSGIAARFGDVSLYNSLYINSRAGGDEMVITDPADLNTLYKVWHSGNDGHSNNPASPGPDASLLDGEKISFRYTTTCAAPSVPALHHCFCADVTPSTTKCIALQ
jgi:hypothetical protein